MRPAGRPADLIRERNALDVELYAFASARLDEILAAEPPGFRDELRRFRRLNAVYGALVGGARRAGRTLPAPVRRLVRRGLETLRPG